MEKGISLLVLSMLCLAAFVLPAHASATKLYVSPLSCAVGRVGRTFTVDVAVAGVTNLYGFEFKLSYNTSLLDAKSVAQGSLFPGSPKSHVLVSEVNDTGGYVWFAVTLLAPEPAKTGSGVLATITFNATFGTTYPQTAGCELSLYETKLSDQAAQPIVHDAISGYYTFIPILGDLDGDGAVDIFDLVILVGAFGSQPGDPTWDLRADLNSDNLVDIFDAVLLANNYGKTG